MDLSYDPEDNILFVSHTKPVHLASEQQIQAYFDEVVAFWRAKCKSKRVYFVIEYDGLTVDVNLKETYAKQVARGVRDCAITIVRYGGEPLQRTVARLVGIQLHVPSNVYRSRHEAIAVVRGLRAKESR
ncbi:hypothetical protein LZC95_32495 [Pendulispora brunnea]|uniref:STAS/SEC14 domain-containing protein n=1 Tax=Pendulispora brunnea TaxID=2905690 RepID=A0ABZ2K1B9_9BACT